MKNNEVLEAIRNRRSRFRFKDEKVDMENIKTILEAGRWAPSFGNSQPWEFIVVSDKDLIDKLSKIAGNVTIFSERIKHAQFMIAVVVDPEKDSYHFVEDGAVASQNMALAAHSLGLAAYWIGIYNRENKRKSAERQAKELLGVPKEYRMISILPIGKPEREAKSKRRKIDNIVHYDKLEKKYGVS